MHIDKILLNRLREGDPHDILVMEGFIKNVMLFGIGTAEQKEDLQHCLSSIEEIKLLKGMDIRSMNINDKIGYGQ